LSHHCNLPQFVQSMVCQRLAKRTCATTATSSTSTNMVWKPRLTTSALAISRSATIQSPNGTRLFRLTVSNNSKSPNCKHQTTRFTRSFNSRGSATGSMARGTRTWKQESRSWRRRFRGTRTSSDGLTEESTATSSIQTSHGRVG